MESDEEEFQRLGFQRALNGRSNQPIFGAKGELLYWKGFWRNHKDHGYSSCYTIAGSRHPDTLEYELYLERRLGGDPITEEIAKVAVSAEELEVVLELLDIKERLKARRNLPEGVNLDLDVGIKLEVKAVSPRIKGTDLNKIYADFEQALIGLGYLEQSIRDQPSRVVYGWQVGL